MRRFCLPGITLPPRLQQHKPRFCASQHQEAIGWQNFLLGHIAQTIIGHQEAYFRARENPDEETGQLWAGKLIATLWTFFSDTWQLRCDERQAQDKDDASKQHTYCIHARTQVVYSLIPTLPVAMRSLHWFDLALDKQLELGTHPLEVWLAHTETLTQKGLAEMNHYLLANNQDIRYYFAPIAVPHPPPN